MRLSDEVTSIKGIGEKNAALLKKLDIETVGDLLYHIPKDYARMPYPVTVREAVKASEPGFTAVCGVVTKAPVLKRFGSRSVVSFEIRDDLGDALNVSYFNMPYIKNAIKKGDRRIFAGRISAKGNRFSLNQPKLYREAEYSSLAGTLIPVYAKTKGMSDQVLAKYNLMALKGLSRTVNDTGLVIDHLPGELKEKNSLSDLLDALWVLHCPAASDNVRKALDRISYDELLFFMLTVSSSDEGREKTEFIIPPSKVSDSLIKKLPYKLTASQTKAIGQIREDMQSGMSLNRLLQGDVGSGKTIVALLAMLDAVDAGYQTALMAPTEVLAVQHYKDITELTQKNDLPFKSALLTGSVTAKQKKEILSQLESGEINVLIGTHALIEDNVKFKNIALVITDEQHRFGVKQREKIRDKGKGGIHTLVMSATPIPRSLAIALYGQLDITEMTDMPVSRKKIKNCVVDQSWRPSAYKFINEQIKEGRQAYVICPMAQPGVMEELENVVDYAGMLREQMPEGTRIEYLHGKLRPKAKNEIMDRFARGETDILVSTTVIEVGVNVPNATVILIENAERFGLATLHQIRGRVGRSDMQSYCVFMESDNGGKKNPRLEILNGSDNGFEIAKKDLELRGPGDITGLVQSGEFSFRFADIYRDSSLLLKAAEDAKKLLKDDPGLSKPEHRLLREKLSAYREDVYIEIL